jgi:hypothetical protein
MIRLSILGPLVTVLTLTAFVQEADAGARRSRPVRTGQAACWDTAGTVIDCAGTGQDGELRRGEPRAYQDNGDGTIRDKRTALTWEKLSDDGSIHDQDNVYSWDDAFGKIDDLNTTPCFAGFCDWRVPNRFELESIVDLGTADPAVSAPFDTGCSPGCTVLTCSCTYSGVYWTSSSAATAESIGWAVNFFFGSVNRNYIKATDSYFVRAVRGGS